MTRRLAFAAIASLAAASPALAHPGALDHGSLAAGMAHPFLASVVVLGLLAAAAYTVPVGAGMALVASFALFHGYAHGGELGGANALAFGLGFAASTALLHMAGIGLGRLLGSSTGRILIRFMGGATAVAGLVMAMGA